MLKAFPFCTAHASLHKYNTISNQSKQNAIAIATAVTKSDFRIRLNESKEEEEKKQHHQQQTKWSYHLPPQIACPNSSSKRDDGERLCERCSFQMKPFHFYYCVILKCNRFLVALFNFILIVNYQTYKIYFNSIFCFGLFCFLKQIVHSTTLVRMLNFVK